MLDFQNRSDEILNNIDSLKHDVNSYCDKITTKFLQLDENGKRRKFKLVV